MSTHESRRRQRKQSPAAKTQGDLYCAGCQKLLVPRGKKYKCVACNQLFCESCLPKDDRPIVACDPCIKAAIESLKDRQRARVVDALKRLDRIKRLKDELAAKRDELRKEIDDVTDICESMDRSVEEIGVGLQSLRGGLEAASELL